MPFKERTASWWHRVAKDKCQYEIYSERSGIKPCNNPSQHVHHIVPEGGVLFEGGEPEHEVGMPLCARHHVKNIGTTEYSKDFSFHPDAGEAYKEYHDWKMENAHLGEITGKRSRKIPRQSPFADMADEHRKKQAKGERYHSGTPELDDYYTQKMRDKATRYLAEHPDDPKPMTSDNPRTDRSRKKHWYDGLF